MDDERTVCFRTGEGIETSPYAYDEFPALEGIPDELLLKAIHYCRLSPEDSQLAIGRLIWRTKYIVLADVLGMSRTTAARILRNKIVPRIVRALGRVA